MALDLKAFYHAADLIAPPGDDWKPHPHQLPPLKPWFGWLLMAGRGAGKTEATSRYFWEHINGPPCVNHVPGGHWPAIIAPTLGDGITSCVNGPSGLKKWDPNIRAVTTPGGAVVKFPNGCEAKIFGAHTPDDVERLRSGGNRCLVWAEELAAWRYLDEAFQHMRYGLRLGPDPHWIASTTPKNRTLIKKMKAQSRLPEGTEDEELGRIRVVHATTDDNPDLPKHVRSMLYADYGGTRLGRQELYGEIIEDVDGALWTSAMIEQGRLQPFLTPERFDRIVVGVDPPGKATGDECGIVVVGKVHKYKAYNPHDPKSLLPHGFVLQDYSQQGTPNEWANKVVQAFNDWGADSVVAEINNGWDMVKATMRNVDDSLPVNEVHASRGKQRRAEPVVALYEQERIHHLGGFGLLEEQMTGWDASDPQEDWSPDRMDALVWACWSLLVKRGQSYSREHARDERLRGRR